MGYQPKTCAFPKQKKKKVKNLKNTLYPLVSHWWLKYLVIFAQTGNNNQQKYLINQLHSCPWTFATDTTSGMVKMILPSLSFHSSQGTKLTAMKSMVSFRCHLNSVAVPGAVCAWARLQEFSQCWVPVLAMHKEDKFYLEHTHTSEQGFPLHIHLLPCPLPRNILIMVVKETQEENRVGKEAVKQTATQLLLQSWSPAKRETVWAPASTASCETEENM